MNKKSNTIELGEEQPGVSIVVVSYNEERNIAPCLKSLLALEYSNFEIVVVDGNSTDTTQDIVRGMIAEHPGKIRLVINQKKRIAPARNLGVAHASHALIAFTDADCTVPTNWLSILVEALRRNKGLYKHLAGVGGANIPPQMSNSVQRLIGYGQATLLGSFGSAQGTVSASEKQVVSIANCNALYDRSTIEAVGGYDESLQHSGEDYDLNKRLTLRGYVLLFCPRSFVWHELRRTWRAYARNMLQYGSGRAQLMHKHGFSEFRYLVALMCLPILLVSLLKPTVTLILVAGYILGISISSARILLKNRTLDGASFGGLLVYYMITHFVYSIGLWHGLIAHLVQRNKTYV